MSLLLDNKEENQSQESGIDAKPIESFLNDNPEKSSREVWPSGQWKDMTPRVGPVLALQTLFHTKWRGMMKISLEIGQATF